DAERDKRDAERDKRDAERDLRDAAKAKNDEIFQKHVLQRLDQQDQKIDDLIKRVTILESYHESEKN
ncbi:hypothetical protein ACW95P_03000, partial [Candidatus Mycoplasma pogonae]